MGRVLIAAGGSLDKTNKPDEGMKMPSWCGSETSWPKMAVPDTVS